MNRTGDPRWVAAMFAVVAFGALLAVAETSRPDIMLALDNSASMRTNDPQFLMAASVLDFAKALPSGARLGILVFDSKPQIALPLTASAEPDFIGKVQRSLVALNYRGKQTDIPGAIERCVYELREDGRPDAPQSVVVLTDGIVDTGNSARDERRKAWLRTELAQEAQARSIRIISVAFTEGADFELMQALAQSTGGQHFRVLEPGQINHTFQRIAAILSAPIAHPVREVSGTVTAAPSPTGERQGVASANRLIFVNVFFCAVALLVFLVIVWLWRRHKLRLSVQASLTDMSDPREIHHLKKQVSYVGRARGSDVVISHRTVGQRQASIEFDGGAFWLRDLRSRNGTWLNSKRLSTEKELLRGGDIVRFHKFSYMFSTAEAQQTEFGGTVTEVLVFCPNHPDEPALKKCGQCKQKYCSECVSQQGDQIVCNTCRGGNVAINMTTA